ncbi:MAG: hypothetical protein JST92_20075 [Deltaproteobacteria bacterium]|nr:hypothetical protein [Deltaproteobacteria bacterium]
MTRLFSSLAALVLLAAAAPAFAGEEHTKADCQALSAKDGSRSACVHCVSRKVKSHYLDDQPAGSRCHADGEPVLTKKPATTPAPVTTTPKK